MKKENSLVSAQTPRYMNIKRISTNPVVRRGVTFILLTLFVAAICWWTVHIPYAPEKLLRSVPFDAKLVSAHENLFENLDELVKNPLVQPYYNDLREQLNKQGVDIESSFLRNIIKRFTERFVLISYTSACPVSGKNDIWTAASWIGADSIWLRWMLELKTIPGITRLDHGGLRPMWHIDSNSEISYSFAFDEGVIVVCVSRDPFAIHNVMLTYEGRLPGLNDQREKKHFAPLFAQTEKGIPGKGMLDYSLVLKNHPAESLFFEIDEFSEQRIAASALLDEAGVKYATFDNAAGFPELSLITGDSASAIFFFSQSLLQLSNLIPDQKSLNGLTNVISDIVTSEPEDVIALGIFAGEFSGRFGTPPFRPTVPALMLFLRTPKATGVIESAQQIIDYLNARFRIGLIVKPEPVQAGNYSIFPVETTSGDFLAHADPEDMPAFVHIGEWIVISSNLRGLTRLTARTQTEAWQTESKKCRWLSQMTNFPATIYSWLDTDSGGQSAQLMLAVYAFSMMGRTDPDTQAAIARLTMIRKWIDKIRPLGSCGIWLNLEGNQPVFNFELNIHPL